jgi:hypothetical protein
MYTLIDLDARRWQSEHIRGYVLALARCGQHELLASLEPLHTIREHSPAGDVLWIAYNWYAARYEDGTHWAIEAAMRRWPGDERVGKMRDLIAGEMMRLESAAD